MNITLKDNPFSIVFGKEPRELIRRDEQLSMIEDIFTREYASNQVFVLTGVRGSGKTVALTDIYETFRIKKDWITIDINSSGDMLTELTSKLYETSGMQKLFIKAGINLSAFGVGVNIENVAPISHISTALEKMLEQVKHNNKRLLICIDEVANTKEMKMFVSTFQILMRHNYPIYLVMTGLYQNIDDLQNEDTLTFLYRAPKINMDTLNITSIANSYKKVFAITNKEAIELANFTNGYAFAYQLLGFLCFENKTTNINDVLTGFEENLTELVYEKIWRELTPRERDVIVSIAKGHSIAKDICDDLKIGSGTLSTYKIRLKKKGLIQTDKYGSVVLSLPRFKEIVNETLIYLE